MSTTTLIPDNPPSPSPSREQEIFIRLQGNHLILTDRTGLFGIPSGLRGELDDDEGKQKRRSVSNTKRHDPPA